MGVQMRLVSFHEYNEQQPGTHDVEGKENRAYTIRLFGIDGNGETYSIKVQGFTPRFYCKVPDYWRKSDLTRFTEHIKEELGSYYQDSLVKEKEQSKAVIVLLKRKKLNGFDAQREHLFARLTFANITTMNKIKNKLWYGEEMVPQGETPGKFDKLRKGIFYRQKLRAGGYLYTNAKRGRQERLPIYEANIPPLLRYFHIHNISPSGWVELDEACRPQAVKRSSCDYDYSVTLDQLKPRPDLEAPVPYKICSFDIEASSSHGDFPQPKKDYKKLAQNILEEIEKYRETSECCDEVDKRNMLERCLLAGFGYTEMSYIDIVYPKTPLSEDEVRERFNLILNDPLTTYKDTLSIEEIDKPEFEEGTEHDCTEDPLHPLPPHDDPKSRRKKTHTQYDQSATVLNMIWDPDFPKESKINELRKALNSVLPLLHGDITTFIGSTFIRHGEDKPYRNHILVLGGCDDIPNIEVQRCKTERELLLAWTRLIQEENPDIVTGYNIFGFDDPFLFHRAAETGCLEDFLQLTRMKGESSGVMNWNTHELELVQKSVFIASGEHNLNYFNMIGRLQIDLYNLFRRDYNLDSYKLDNVSAHFIGDFVHRISSEQYSTVYSNNLQGLEVGNFVVFEEVGHSSDYYKQNDTFKFEVIEISLLEKCFTLKTIVNPNMDKKVKWCLAKDDVDHHDIFRLSKGTDADRAIIAKYCIQDCNLVHHLMRKIDIMTGFVEMANICSVPMDFLVMRGQGIKLTSFIANKCKEKKILMPVLPRGDSDEGYEGAIVLTPKCDIYADDPVAVNDYSSLYPSCMISEGLSQDSKVWTKEYDLEGNLIHEWPPLNSSARDKEGTFIYDNLPEYKYIDVEYDTYQYIRKTPKAAKTKIKCGKKVCRFAEFPEGRPVMPSVLEELLAARKATKKLIPKQKDEFMRNVYDKRQLAYKLTANSLYGGCGAKSSTFYDIDVAASCTATGRKLLIYAKTVVEEAYKDCVCETSLGQVRTMAEYVYGDTDSVFFKFNLEDPFTCDKIEGEKALQMTIELAEEAGRLATMFLKPPHDLEYEKTFAPLLLLSKKRYVGLLFETDTKKCKRKSMGLVLKRRDNAPIVKDVYGGLIDILMDSGDIGRSIQFVLGELERLRNGEIPIEKLTITKSLRSGYKNPKQIAHKVLADRIGERDPGNKPRPGDRMKYAYVKTEGKTLQGDKIETPEFISTHKLELDYEFYVTNQIMKPVQQVFALVLEQLPNFDSHRENYEDDIANVDEIPEDPEKYAKKLLDVRNRYVKMIVFDR